MFKRLLEESAECLTFDDVSMVPAYSKITPADVDIKTRLTRGIELNIPLVSAAMDTVTESRLAIAMAQHGGVGIIHRNLSIERQAAEVDIVKRYESGMITNPITLPPDETISTVREVMQKYNISGIPITENGKLVGILTNRDMRFEKDTTQRIAELMTKDLITVPEGTTLEEAKEILHKHRIEKLPVVDKDMNLKGLITFKDIKKKA